MTTSYSLADTLPKDAGGQKFAGWVDLATSQLDFSLPGGIGSKTTGSKITAALWSGNGLAGCRVEPTGGVGTLQMAHWSSAASSTATQNGIHLRANDRGELYHSSLAATTCAMSGSRETVTVSSGLLYSLQAVGCGLVAGACVTVFNGTASLAQFMFDSAFNTYNMTFPNGTCFGSLIWERRNSAGVASLIAVYRNFGQ